MIDHILMLKKNYMTMFNQLQLSDIKDKKKRFVELKHEIKKHFKFVGAQPMQFTGNDVFQVTRQNVVFSPKIDGKRKLMVLDGTNRVGFISRNGDVSISKLKLNIPEKMVLDVEYVERNGEMRGFGFDVLYYIYDKRHLRYHARRDLLNKIIMKFPNDVFYLNASFPLSSLYDYNVLVQRVFPNVLPSWLTYDGIIFYDRRYNYPMNKAHYGTWKWKPSNEQTIDLRVQNHMLSFRSKGGFVNITEFKLSKPTTCIHERQSKKINFIIDDDTLNYT